VFGSLINKVLSKFFSTGRSVWKYQMLQKKNFYFEQVLHSIKQFCGKDVENKIKNL
jgi:hypothetical protein